MQSQLTVQLAKQSPLYRLFTSHCCPCVTLVPWRQAVINIQKNPCLHIILAILNMAAQHSPNDHPLRPPPPDHRLTPLKTRVSKLLHLFTSWQQSINKISVFGYLWPSQACNQPVQSFKSPELIDWMADLCLSSKQVMSSGGLSMKGGLKEIQKSCLLWLALA